MAPPVVERAKRDLAAGRTWLARQRLETFVRSSGYDAAVVELLAEVCWRMGDAPAAGRYWFFVPLSTDAQRQAVDAFLAHAGSDSQQILAHLPKKLRASAELLAADPRERLQRLIAACPESERERLIHGSPMKDESRYHLTCALAGVIGLFVTVCFVLGFAKLMEMIVGK